MTDTPTYIGEFSNLQRRDSTIAPPHGSAIYRLTLRYEGEAQTVSVVFPQLASFYTISVDEPPLTRGVGNGQITILCIVYALAFLLPLSLAAFLFALPFAPYWFFVQSFALYGLCFCAVFGVGLLLNRKAFFSDMAHDLKAPVGAKPQSHRHRSWPLHCKNHCGGAGRFHFRRLYPGRGHGICNGIPFSNIGKPLCECCNFKQTCISGSLDNHSGKKRSPPSFF